jgi:hypothetical protein
VADDRAEDMIEVFGFEPESVHVIVGVVGFLFQ